MPTLRTETAIIGGGLMGCWTAYFLRRRGRSVTVLEKGSVGAQASGVNFGNVRLQGRHPRQMPLAIRSHEQWEQLETLIGSACEFEATGHFYVACNGDEQAKLEHYAADARANGIAVELLTPAELRARWPWLGVSAVGGCYSARDGAANPRLVTPAVARAARGLGAEIFEDTRVIAVEKSGGSFRVTTDRDIAVESEFLVNAAGAWALDIAAGFNETAPMFAAGPPQFVTEPLPYFIEPSVQFVDGSVIFRQVRRGNVVVAGYPRGPSDPVANRAPVPPAKTLATMRRLAEAVPLLASAHVIRVWSGIEGYIPDMLPVIGPSATTERLIHAFGFCGHGFQLGPGVGLVLSEMIVDGGTPTPLDAFSITRFNDPDAASSWTRREEFDETLTTSIGARR